MIFKKCAWYEFTNYFKYWELSSKYTDIKMSEIYLNREIFLYALT